MSPFELVIGRLESLGMKPRRCGQSYTAHCPCLGHDDKTPSLSVSEGQDGRALLKCHAGCETTDVVIALGLTMADLFPRRRCRGDAPVKETVYEIRDTSGEVIAEHVRLDLADGTKRVFWRRDGKPGLNGLKVTELPLYGSERLPELQPGSRIVLTEGEKACDALRGRGIAAVATVTGASGCPSGSVLRMLEGLDVVHWPDSDRQGAEHMRRVAACLIDLGLTPRLFKWKDAPKGGDAADYFERGGTTEALEAVLDDAQPISSVESAETVEGEWPDLMPLGPDLSGLPPFPTRTLPEPLRGFVVGLAAQVQAPVEMVAAFALAVMSLCVCRRFVARPWPGWLEQLMLYMAVVAPPGTRKSSVESATTKPVHELEKVLAEEREPDIARAKNRRNVLKRALDDAIKQAAKPPRDEKATREAEQLAVEYERASVPPLPRLITTNATNEALSKLLADGDGRVLVATSEGGEVISVAGGLYTKGKDNFDTLLKGWSGDAISIDRKTSGRVYVASPAVVVALMLQPSVMEEIGAHGSFRGRGLLGRFLFTLTSGNVGYRNPRGEPLAQSTIRSYHDLVERLLRLNDATDEHGVLVPREIRFHADAATRLEEFSEWLEVSQREFGELANMRDWASKAHGQAARLAAILHMVQHSGSRAPWEVEVSLMCVEHAIELIEYYLAHAKAAFAAMGQDGERAKALRIARYVQAKQLRQTTKRDLHRALGGVFKKAIQLDGPLEILEERGYVVVEKPERTGAGRKPSPIVRINPTWLGQKRRIGQKPPPETETVNPVDSVSADDDSDLEEEEF